MAFPLSAIIWLEFSFDLRFQSSIIAFCLRAPTFAPQSFISPVHFIKTLLYDI